MAITAKIGFGGKVEGELVVLGANGVLDGRDVNSDLDGKILVLLCWTPREFLEKASLVGVTGIVASSIHSRDFEYFRKHEDIPLLVLGKFGKLDASGDWREKLTKISGKKGELNGEGKTLTV